MLLVYVNHMEIYYGVDIPFAEAVYRPFFVNIFFIVSGYLLFRKYLSEKYTGMNTAEWNTVVKNEYLPNTLFKLAIPTVLFSLINYFPKKIIRGESISLNTTIFDILGGNCLWFTSALVIAQLVICIFLFKKYKVEIYWLLGILLLILADYLSSAEIQILDSVSFPWYYKSGFIAVFLTASGAMYWKYEEVISSYIQSHKWLLGVLTIIYLALVIFTDLAVCDTFGGHMNFIGVIATYVASLVIIEGFKLFKNEPKLISFVAKNSIGFYFLSGSLPNILAILANKIYSHSNVVILVCLVCVAFSLAFVFVNFIVRYLPFLFDLRRLKK